VIPDELSAALELLGDGLELTRSDWPKSELGLRHCNELISKHIATLIFSNQIQ